MFRNIFIKTFFVVMFGMSAVSYGSPMTLDEFKEMVATQSIRCTNSITKKECEAERLFALEKNLYTKEAYEWSRSKAIFPVFNARGPKISGACKCPGSFQAKEGDQTENGFLIQNDNIEQE